MEYTVRRLPEELGCLPLQGVFAPEEIPAPYAALEEADIALYPWDETGYKPEAHARVGWNEKGLHALLYAREETIHAECTEIGGRVCVDSCLEFFCMPFPQEDQRYFNAEMNPLGTLHLGLGEGRPNRVKVREKLPEGFRVSASVHAGGWWAVSYTIPMSWIEETFGRRLVGGQAMRGNFYKCDETIHPHFGTWAPVTKEHPDFHRPECFQPLVLE